MADAVHEALDGPELLYISIDIDSLDPAYAPRRERPSRAESSPPTCCAWSASWPTSTHVVGMDVVEVAPAYDHADCTVNVANRLFMECLAGMAAKRRDRRRRHTRSAGALINDSIYASTA